MNICIYIYTIYMCIYIHTTCIYIYILLNIYIYILLNIYIYYLIYIYNLIIYICIRISVNARVGRLLAPFPFWF